MLMMLLLAVLKMIQTKLPTTLSHGQHSATTMEMRSIERYARALSALLGSTAQAQTSDPCAPPPVTPSDPIGFDQLPAPLLSIVSIFSKQDSVLVSLPVVQGAKDYRIFAITPSVKIQKVGTQEHVIGAEIYCGGIEQHNAPIALPVPIRDIQVDGVFTEGAYAVEALDRPCPFPGVMGLAHSDQVVYEGDDPAEIVPFSIWTPEEMIARYGSVLHNGHGISNRLGAPAQADDPVVLARALIKVAPKAPVKQTVWHDFAASGSATRVRSLVDDAGRSQQGVLFSDKDFNYYSYGNQHTQVFNRDGVLHHVIADWHQDIFGAIYFVPKRPVQIATASFVHSTFEISSDSSGRRYWWWFLCGADTLGQTLNLDGTLKSPIVQTPFFMEPDGRNPSLANWNCLQIFPRDGSPIPISDNVNPQSDIRVMINKAGLDRGSVVNVSPKQYSNNWVSNSWYRQQDAAGKISGPMLDDKLQISPRNRYDVYVSRQRAVLYVDGQQRLCNDYPATLITMAEAALGYGQVLYHSAAERNDFTRSYYNESAQVHWLNNTPYVDEHTWDNVGFSEAVNLPADFDSTKCYRYTP